MSSREGSKSVSPSGQGGQQLDPQAVDPQLHHLQGNLRPYNHAQFLVPIASRMEGRQQNPAGSGGNPSTTSTTSMALPFRPHSQVQTEESNYVMIVPGDSLTQGQGSASDISFPTSPQTDVYDPELFQDTIITPNQSNNGMPNSIVGVRAENDQMFDPNLRGPQPQFPRPIRGPRNIAPGDHMLDNFEFDGGSTNARTDAPVSLADQFLRTMPLPMSPMQGFVPPPDQTSFGQGGCRELSLFALLEQFERETSWVPELTARDDNVKEDDAADDENGTELLAGTDLASMSLEELLGLHEVYFREYVRDSWAGLNDEVYSAANLPQVLFQLEPSVDPLPRRSAFDHGFIHGPDGQPIKGPNGRSIIKFPCLPRYISTDAEGWCYEAWDRMDRGIEDSDYVSRMNVDEFKLVQAINKARLKGSRKKKAAESEAKEAGTTPRGRRSRASATTSKQTAERDLMAKNFVNGINMRRTRAFRDPFGVFAWVQRSGKGNPSMRECQAVSRLSEDSIRHNTSLEVTPHGLQRVRLQGGYGEVRSRVNLDGQFWPRDLFLINHKLHTPSPRLQECRKIALDLNEKLIKFGVIEWKDLPREELPAWWFAKADKAKERVARKRKAADDPNDVCPAKKARHNESIGDSCGHREHQEHPEYYSDADTQENMPAYWEGEQGAMYYPDPTALGAPSYTTMTQQHQPDILADSYRRGLREHVEVNLGGHADVYSATDPEFQETLQAEMRAEWRHRIDDPDVDAEEKSVLEALRGEFGN